MLTDTICLLKYCSIKCIERPLQIKQIIILYIIINVFKNMKKELKKYYIFNMRPMDEYITRKQLDESEELRFKIFNEYVTSRVPYSLLWYEIRYEWLDLLQEYIAIVTEIQNNIAENYGSSSYYSYDNTQGLRKGNGKISLTMAKGSDLQLKYLKDKYQYISFKTESNKIGSTAHYETLTFIAKIKFTSSPVSISSWEIIVLNMDFKIVDEGSFTLKNAIASY